MKYCRVKKALLVAVAGLCSVVTSGLMAGSCDQTCANCAIEFVRPWQGHGCGTHVKLCPTGTGQLKYEYSSIPDSTVTGWHADANFFFNDSLFVDYDCVDVQFLIRVQGTTEPCCTLTQTLCKGALTDVSVTVTQPTCAQAGSIAVDLTSIPVPTPGYSASYDVELFNNGQLIQSCICEITQATPTCTCTFNNVAPGTYIVCASLNPECQICTGNVIVNPIPSIGVSISQEDPSCGQYDGTITVDITGEITPGASYTYFCDGQSYGPTTNLTHTFTGLQAQVYHVYVVDSNGCQSILENVVLADQGADFTISAVATGALCNGASDGTITVFVYDGLSTYQYSFDNGVTWQDSNFIDGLPAENYHIIVEDTYTGCRVATTATIGQPDPLFATVDAFAPLCFGQNGSIHIVVFGGTEPFTVKITPLNDPLNPVIIPVGPSHEVIFFGLPGLYDIEATDANGCYWKRDYPIEIPATTEIIITAEGQAAACYGSDGSITISATGGSPTYIFSVDGTQVAFNVPENTPVTVEATVGTHQVSVQDTNQCIVTSDYVEVPETPQLVIDVTSIIAPVCYGETGFVTCVITGGVPPYTVTFDGQQETDVVEGQTVTFEALPGDYTITVQDYDGCTQETSVTIPGERPLLFEATRACGGLNIIINGGTPVYRVYANGELLNTPVPLADQPTFVRLPTGLYEITVVDNNGCMASHPYALVTPCGVSTVPTVLPEEPPSVIQPPKDLCGYQECHRFPTQSDLVTCITWRAGDQKAVSYEIYASTDLNNPLAIISASSPLVYCRHNQRCGQTITYYIYAIDASGNNSQPATITIP